MKVNREIKFRAWDKATRKVLEVIEIDFQGREILVIDHEEQEAREAVNGHYELMQFTGLRDEDGTEIYEGDIVEVDREKSVIESVPGGFTVASLPLVEVSNYGMKVIGNIHENTELLECGEE